jgi:hypothetical protein
MHLDIFSPIWKVSLDWFDLKYTLHGILKVTECSWQVPQKDKKQPKYLIPEE